MSKMSEGSEPLMTMIDAMKLGGLWFDFGDSKYGTFLKWFNVFRSAVAILIWVTQLFYLCVGGLSFLLSESAVFIPIGLAEFALAFQIIFNLKTVNQVIHIYERRLDAFAKDPWARDIMRKVFDKADKLFQAAKVGLTVFFLTYLIFPVVFDLTRAFFDKDPYVVPLPLNFLLDRPLNRNRLFYGSLFTSYLYFVIIVPRFIASEALLVYFVAFIVIDIKVCVRKLKNLDDGDDGTVALQEGWDLRDIIDHHSKIINLVKGPYQFVACAIIGHNLVATCTNCLVLFLMKRSLENGDLVLAMFCGSFFVFLIGFGFVMNGAGYLVEQQSEELSDAIYNRAWYKQHPRVRKEVHSMIRQAVKLLSLSYRLSSVSMSSYLQVLNKSYSFFTLISSRQ